MNNFIPICDPIWRHDKRLAMLRDDCGIPFDWREFCDKVDLRVYIDDVYGDGRGRYHPGTNSIYLDSKLTEQQLRWTACHEIGHWMLQNCRNRQFVRNALVSGRGRELCGRESEEREADRFAAALLVSPKAIAELATSSGNCMLQLIAKVRFTCRVSWTVAIRRVLEAAGSDLTIVETGPCVASDLGSPPMVISSFSRSDTHSESVFSAILMYVESSFEAASLEHYSVAATTVRDPAARQGVTWLPIAARRVSMNRTLVAFDACASGSTRGDQQLSEVTEHAA